MSERRAWTQQQDKALKHLRDVVKVTKWSQISRRLEFEFHLPGRNGKQCRERYTNHLADSINFTEFNEEEEQRLFRLHDLIGNKWSQICKDFSGRTENQMKNHFHSKLRKAIRKLNKQIKLYFKKTTKPYKLSIVYKIVEASDFRFTTISSLNQENFKFFNHLKNSLIQYAGGLIQHKSQISTLSGKNQVELLISQLVMFENQQKHNKQLFTTGKKNKKSSNRQLYPEHKLNSSTQNSEHSELLDESDQQDENIQEEDMIYEEMSFQFVHEAKKVNSNLPIMEEEQTDSQTNENTYGEGHCAGVSKMAVKELNGFLNSQNLLLKSVPKFSDLINNLTEERYFPDIQVDRKLSVKSFESLRSFQDAYLNDSEINMMLKRFDSYSNIEQRIFE